jgi:RNA polymerase sigma factor (sigma-70 family)
LFPGHRGRIVHRLDDWLGLTDADLTFIPMPDTKDVGLSPGATDEVEAAGAPKGARGLDAFLALLDDDRDRAAQRYLSLRRRLVRYFGWRGAHVPEELADETLDRVCARASDTGRPFSGDPGLYVFGVARNVLREYWRQRATAPVEDAPEGQEDAGYPEGDEELEHRSEHRAACLETCLQKLEPAARELILRYYREEKQAKIADRGEMARALGIGAPALRLRLHRIRGRLEPCVKDCLARVGGEMKRGIPHV